MPEADPSAERTFIWIIACILFICVLAGGGCLVAYTVLPVSQVPPWTPRIGIMLVCLPWAFWLLTFLYRIFSRICGCRINVGGVGRERLGDGGRANAPGDASVKENNGINRTFSVASHESQMPLAKSMAS
ncbi:uncharacterized protein LOC109814839 [Cajanus cajan]|uniref:Uncharacterized protein n=1 Tax=Cajanus cajan TaxID=3821 RepID=A0A151RY32_CAJCA|nr:uncharacterized protein LOC109814839 [Cajanus cajan]KYP47466.1 hypothetical protein KK1_030926 [Cajanus cajan]